MAEDITIRIPSDQAVAGAKEINQGVESIERTAVKAGAALGTELGKGAERAVSVIHASTNTINRAMDSITAKIRATGVSAPTPIQQVEALRMQGITRTAGDPRAFEQINAAAAAQTRILQENAAAQLKASAAAEQHNRTMRASDEQWSRFRANAMGAKQALDNLRVSEERAAVSNARYMQQQALVGRTPTERRDIQRQQEHESALSGAGMDPANRALLIRYYDEANKRLAEQDKLQKQAAISAGSLGGELKNSVERLGAAFVAFQLWNIAVKEGIIGTAMAAARTETLDVALGASTKSNNLGSIAVRSRVEEVKKLGITTEDARQALIRMIVVELDTTKATNLARLAQDAAVISNMNSSDAFQQMIYGIQSGQVRVLRTIGINVQFQASYQRLADQLHKNVLDLTEQEKAQSRLNEVLRVAPQYAGIYEESMTSIGKQMTSLKRYFKEAQDSIGKEFLPQLGTAVRTLTELAKFGEQNPKAGSVLAILGGGAAVALGAKFMLGDKAAGIVAIAAAVYAATKAIDALGDLFMNKIWDITIRLDELAKTVGTWMITPREFPAKGLRPKELPISAYSVEDGRVVPYHKDEKFISDTLTARIKTMRDDAANARGGVVGGTMTVDILKEMDVVSAAYFDKMFKNINRQEYLEARLSQVKAAREESMQAKAWNRFAANTAEMKQLEAELDLYKQQEQAEKLLAATRENNAVKEHEYMRESYKLLDEINKLHMSIGTKNQLYGELNNTIIRESNKELGEQKTAYNKVVLKMREMNSELVKMDKINGVIDTSVPSKKITDDYLSSAAGNRKLDRDLAYADLQRQSELELKLNEGAEGATVRSIETTYSKRIQMAQDYWNYENAKVQEIEDLKERLAAGEKLYKDKYNMLGDAEVERVTKLIQLQQDHFNALQRSFEGLFDAAFEGAKSFTNALRRMMLAVFLTPIKEQMSRMFAGMFMGMQGQGATGGAGGSSAGVGGGILNRIFNSGGVSNTTNRVSETLNVNVTGGSGGINSVRLVNGAVPVVIVGTAASAERGGGSGSATATAIGAGAGFLGGLLSRSTARTIGGEVIGAGGSTAGLVQDASGLWLRGAGAGAGGGSALAGGAATGLVGLPGFGGAGLPGMMPGWAGSTSLGASAGAGGAGGSGGGGFGGIGGMLKNMNWANAAQGLALMGGMGLVSAGLQRKNSGMTIAGGAAMGYGAASMMGMTGLGGAITGVGGGLVAAGLMRGGVSGLGMTAAGGALVGLQFGGPIGALVGAIIGAGAGAVRLLIKSASEKAHDKIKALYSIDIRTRGVLDQIVASAKQSFGGNLDMAIRSQQIRELIELYAMSTGQGRGGLPANMQPYSMVQMGGGSLYSQPFGTGSLVRLGASSGNGGGGTVVVPISMDSKAIGTVIVQNGRVIADGALNAAKSNYRRVDGNLTALSPSTIRG
jgi:hypothetical protein